MRWEDLNTMKPGDIVALSRYRIEHPPTQLLVNAGLAGFTEYAQAEITAVRRRGIDPGGQDWMQPGDVFEVEVHGKDQDVGTRTMKTWTSFDGRCYPQDTEWHLDRLLQSCEVLS